MKTPPSNYAASKAGQAMNGEVHLGCMLMVAGLAAFLAVYAIGYKKAEFDMDVDAGSRANRVAWLEHSEAYRDLLDALCEDCRRMAR